MSTARDGMKADAIYREMITRHAQAHGLQLLHTFEDIGLSGRKGSRRRPQFEEMLAQAEAGEFDSIIVPKLSRFGRSMRDNLEAYDRLEGSGVGIAFLDLGIDTSTAAGKLVRNVLTAAAEFESDLISERWKDTHAYLARNGRPSGNATYGYRYNKATKVMTPHPAQARIVKGIFERYADGEGMRAIGRDLERRGVRGLRGSTRWQVMLGYLLDSPTYIGLRPWDGEMIEATWEPIIDRELWDRVQARRQAVRAGHAAAGRGSARALLSGLLMCGQCGGPMWHLGDRYRCGNGLRKQGCTPTGIRAAKAESAVAEQFLARLSEMHARHVRGSKKRILKGLSRTEPKENGVEKDLQAVERKMRALVEMTLDLPAGFDDVARRTAAELEARRNELQSEQARRVAAVADNRVRAERAVEFVERLADLPAIWEAATTAERNEMLHVAIDRIDVVPDGRLKTVGVTWAEPFWT